MANNPITQVIVLDAVIRSTAPFHIGSGLGDNSDMDILLDTLDRPVITGSGLGGVLRHELEHLKPDGDDFEKKRRFFLGYTERENGNESRIWLTDLPLCSDSPSVVVRDGIEIDDAIGQTAYQSKYDFEVAEQGGSYRLKLTCFSGKKDDISFNDRMVRTLYERLDCGELQVGGMKNDGLGTIRLEPAQSNLYRYDFTQKRDVCNWLLKSGEEEQKITPDKLGAPFESSDKPFLLEMNLKLKKSLISRTNPGDPDGPDAVHRQSGGKPVLTGKEIKGAVRARAKRIIKTLDRTPSIIDELFGMVKKDGAATRAVKGRVTVKESLLPDYLAELQRRITINRLTGGTIQGRLFNSEPLFDSGDGKTLKITMAGKNLADAQIGSLLLVMKDLWTEDLAIAGEKGIGRGVFTGVNAVISCNEKVIIIDDDPLKLSEDDQKYLNQYVKRLNAWKPI